MLTCLDQYKEGISISSTLCLHDAEGTPCLYRIELPLESNEDAGTQRRLSRIRSLASVIFRHAVITDLLESEPWHDVKILGKVKTPKPTSHYTLEEAKNIIHAGITNVKDFGEGVVRSVVGNLKTEESTATMPLWDQRRTPLELWRRKCDHENNPDGWIFSNKPLLSDSIAQAWERDG